MLRISTFRPAFRNQNEIRAPAAAFWPHRPTPPAPFAPSCLLRQLPRLLSFPPALPGPLLLLSLCPMPHPHPRLFPGLPPQRGISAIPPGAAHNPAPFKLHLWVSLEHLASSATVHTCDYRTSPPPPFTRAHTLTRVHANFCSTRGPFSVRFTLPFPELAQGLARRMRCINLCRVMGSRIHTQGGDWGPGEPAAREPTASALGSDHPPHQPPKT